MTALQDAFTNALLADAAYVGGLTEGETGDPLKTDLGQRMTLSLAEYVSKSFTVLTQIGVICRGQVLPFAFEK